jgi:hypothetical protein
LASSASKAGVVAGLVSLVVPSIAFGQEEPPPAAPPTPAPTEPAPAPKPTAPPEPPNDGHFRWGLSPMFGTFFPGPTTVALGFEGRFGYAFNQMLTVYGNVAAVGGIGFGADTDDKGGGSASVSAISFWVFGANVDALLVGPLFVGGGAGFGKAGWGVVEAHGSNNGAGSRVIAAGGWTPSIDGRIGISTGSPNPQTGKRSGFYLALDVRMLFAPDSAETKQEATATGGTQQVTTDTTAIGICPMLHLGFDSR